jgi:hypothetical protein
LRPPSSARSTRTSNQLSIDQRSWKNGHQREQQYEAQGEPRAEDPGPQVPPQPPELIADESHQKHDHRPIQQQQHVVAAREKLRIRRRGGEQEQRYRRKAGEDEQQPAHPARGQKAAHGVKLHRYHSDCSDHSRDARAFSWKGFGSALTSRRRRIAAS